MGVPVLALIGLATAAYSIYQGHSMSPEQRKATKNQRLAMFWGGIGGTFAAGTPLVAGAGKGAGAAQSGAAGTSEAAAGSTGATAGAASTETTAVASTQASSEFTFSGSAMQASGAPSKWQYASHQIQQGLAKKKGQQLAMQLAQNAASPQQQDQPMATPQPAKASPAFSMEFYDDESMNTSMQEEVIGDDTRRGALRSSWDDQPNSWWEA